MSVKVHYKKLHSLIEKHQTLLLILLLIHAVYMNIKLNDYSDHYHDYAEEEHYHDSDYAEEDHYHDSDYANKSHDHDLDYAEYDHGHF